MSALGADEFFRYRMIGTHRTIDQILKMTEESIRSVSESRAEEETGHLAESMEPYLDSAPVLTPREREVLELVSRGLSDKAIADQLSISPRTAMTHVGNIMTKLNVHSRSAASVAGIQVGLIDDPRREFDEEIDG